MKIQSVLAHLVASFTMISCCTIPWGGTCKDSACKSGVSSAVESAQPTAAATESAPTVSDAEAVSVAKQSLERQFKAVYFAPGSTQISSAGKAALEFNAEILKENAEAVVGLHGVADQTGSQELNKKLAKQRGEAARAYLLSRGVLPTQIHVGEAEVGTERAAIFRVN